MDLSKLFEMQRELDERIEKQHPRQPGDRRIYSKLLALLVEIGELANETRCFKFWSNKGPSSKEKILEEGADVLHFLLSIGNEINVQTSIEIVPIAKSSLDAQFLALYDQARLANIKEQWEWTFNLYVGLMETLGFTWNEVEEAYMSKNAVNHHRQESGY